MTNFKYKVGDILYDDSLPYDFDIVIIQKIEDEKVWVDYRIIYPNKKNARRRTIIETQLGVVYYKKDFIKEFEHFYEMTPEEYRRAIKLVFS